MDVCRTGDVDRLNAAISEGVALTQKGTAGESLLVSSSTLQKNNMKSK